ncbi:MAG: hypothetical protein WDZ75_01735 [Candidatus Paceibacterota bacterium]
MIGKWAQWYKGITKMSSFRYGNTKTYKLAEGFLKGLSVEDWGCGTGGFKRLHHGPYRGIDGTETPFTDVVADLREYQSKTEGIIMRHVLEHNYDWERVLVNALNSFTKRFCLILFTPFTEETKEIAHNLKHGVDVPDLSFQKAELEWFLKGMEFEMETHQTKTAYGVEHIYYIEK